MFFLRTLSRLPLPLLYAISDFLFVIIYFIVGYRKKMVWKNLRNAFPLQSDQELKVIQKEFYRHLCDYGVETLKLLTIDQVELKKRMVYTNAHLVEEYKSKGQSVVMLASHQFNWEWLLAAGNLYLPYPIDFVYQPVSSALFEEFSLQSRSRFGAYPIRRFDVARESFKRRHILRGIAIVADQYPGHESDKRYEAKFLNQDSVFFLGANQLAQMLQCPTVFAKIRRVKRGYYEMELVKLSEPPYTKDDTQCVVNYIKEVEKLIQEHPSGWLWSHNRWKTRHLNQ